MRDKEQPSFISTETIDLNNLFTRNVTSSGSFDLGGTLTTSLGKLLQTIPIPTMLVDGACTIVFANEAFSKLSASHENVLLGSFSALFPEPAAGASVETLIRDVFATRRPTTKDYVMKIGSRRMMGRLHLRPLRVGRRRSVLVIVEDLTRERQGQTVDQKHRPRVERPQAHLEQRLKTRTSQLRIARERLRKEISERTKIQLLLDRLGQEYGRETVQRLAEQVQDDEESRRSKATSNRPIDLTPLADGPRPETAPCDGDKSKNIFQKLACSANAALGFLAAGDVGAARDELERILGDCRASGRALHRLKTDRR
jgi:PAS domain S-box-containing protein